ncbi:centromere-associated protein E-like [Diabrotica virgifera virgifera]|uniref:Centromere-associated protein E-like n=1 Tax=Diabrotica virgifera virgifera TaxID=50390 RepID=A0A6P7FGM9_DIAVI|nr:centromere-associated protein E-like [Diabrotica virgifera virgifera]
MEQHMLESEEVSFPKEYQINPQLNTNFDDQTMDDQPPEAANLTSENIEMENMNNLNLKLNYKQAEAIIHKQCKAFIKQQKTQKTTSEILTQQNNHILQKINAEKKILGLLQLEADKLNTDIRRLDEETSHIVQRQQNACEIVEEMQKYVTELEQNAKNVENNRNELLTKAENQKEKFKSTIDAAVKEYNRLRDLFSAGNNPSGDGDRDSLRKENLHLKQQINENREEFKLLEILYSLKVEKENLETGICEKKNSYNEINKNLDVLESIQEHTVTQFNEEYEKYIKLRVDDLSCDLNRLNQKITAVKEQVFDNEISLKRTRIGETKEMIEKRKEEIAEKQKRIDQMSGEYISKVDALKKQIVDVEKEAAQSGESNQENMQASESLIKTFCAKQVEKDKLLNKKFTLQEKINADQVLLVEIKLLKEKIAAKENAIESLTDAITNISDDKSILELSRKRSYLDACKTFLEERAEITKKKRDEEEFNMQQLQASVEEIKNKCEEKRNEIFKKTGKRVSPKGILKRKGQNKTPPVSPKKVTFINVSTESSVSTQDDEEDTFEKILKQYRMKHRDLKSNPKPNKMKRLVLEDDN